MTSTDIDQLEEFPVADIQACMKSKGVLRSDFRRLWKRDLGGPASVAGRVRTVLTGPNDNLAVHRMLREIEPGDFVVIVSPCQGGAAMWGEIMTRTAMARGARAALIDGGVRDINGILATGFPVWYKVEQLVTASKGEEGELDIPLSIGGQLVRSGEVMIADDDGLICMSRDDIPELVTRVKEHQALEVRLLQHFLGGGAYDDFDMNAEGDGAISYSEPGGDPD